MMSFLETPNWRARTSYMNTTTKKSKASRVQPKKPARTAWRAFAFELAAGSVSCTRGAFANLGLTANHYRQNLRPALGWNPIAFGLHAGRDCPRVSAPKGIRRSPTANASAVIATGIPSEPYRCTPLPTRKVIAAPPKRAKDVEKAKALARHSVGY